MAIIKNPISLTVVLSFLQSKIENPKSFNDSVRPHEHARRDGDTDLFGSL
jgi:hypothetical protein